MYLNTVSYLNDFVTVKSKITGTDFPDRFIQCVDCDESFVWTSGEQTFFRDKGLQNPPKRCRDCKQAKNDRITAINEAQTAGIKQKIEVAIDCAGCGASTTVPFYPSQGRPVYCRSCFLSRQNHLV